MMFEQMYRLLVRSFDDSVTESDQAKLEEALNQSGELRSEQVKLRKIRSLLRDQQFSFRPGFMDRVVAQLVANAPEMELNRNIYYLFKRVAITGAAAIILLLLGIYLTMGTLNFDVILGVESLSDDSLVTFLLFDN